MIKDKQSFFFHLVPRRVEGFFFCLFFFFFLFFRKSLKHYSGSNEKRCCEMPWFIIDGQHRSDWILQNILFSIVAAVSGWKHFPKLLNSFSVCLKHDESWSAADGCWKSFVRCCFCFIPELSGRVCRVVISDEWFQSGWAQRASWDALWEKREASGQPTIPLAGVTVSHKVNPRQTETGKQSVKSNRFCFNLF